jgi:hypothetical protein
MQQARVLSTDEMARDLLAFATSLCSGLTLCQPTFLGVLVLVSGRRRLFLLLLLLILHTLFHN